MNDIERQLDRVLTLLRNKIREEGFTQLEVQEALGWGRSYISQLLTKQKSLRMEQVLLILSVIEVPESDFFGELYPPSVEPDRPHKGTGTGPSESVPADFAGAFGELRKTVRGLLRVLVDKKLVGAEELRSAVEASEGGPDVAELADG